MKIFTTLLVTATLFITTACLPEKEKTAEELANLPALNISNVYAFATMPGASTGAAFMQITNNSDIDDTLLSASAKIAEVTEIHQNIIDPDDGMMMMRKIQNLPINAQESTLLEPKGYHIMFLQLKESLTMGASFPLTLTFEKTGTQTVNVEIIAPGSKYKAAEDAHDHHNH